MHVRIELSSYKSADHCNDMCWKNNLHTRWKITDEDSELILHGEVENFKEAIDAFTIITDEDYFATDHSGCWIFATYFTQDSLNPSKEYPDNASWHYVSNDIVASAIADFPIHVNQKCLVQFLGNPELVQLTPKGLAHKRAHSLLNISEHGQNDWEKVINAYVGVSQMIRNKDWEALDALFQIMIDSYNNPWHAIEYFRATKEVKHNLPSRDKLLVRYKQRLSEETKQISDVSRLNWFHEAMEEIKPLE